MDSNIWGIRYGASTKSNHQVPQDVIALVLTYCCHPYQCLSLRFVSTLSETDPFVAHAVDLTQENPTGGTDLCFKLQIFNDWFRELRSFVNNCQSMWCILSIGTRFFFLLLPQFDIKNDIATSFVHPVKHHYWNIFSSIKYDSLYFLQILILTYCSVETDNTEII